MGSRVQGTDSREQGAACSLENIPGRGPRRKGFRHLENNRRLRSRARCTGRNWVLGGGGTPQTPEQPRPWGSWQRLCVLSLDQSPPFVNEKAEAQPEKGSGRRGNTTPKYKL